MEASSHALMGEHLLEYVMNGTQTVPIGNRHPRFAPQMMLSVSNGLISGLLLQYVRTKSGKDSVMLFYVTTNGKLINDCSPIGKD